MWRRLDRDWDDFARRAARRCKKRPLHRLGKFREIRRVVSHLGRQGGASAFRSDELENLQKVYQRLTRLDANLLARACEKAQQPTIPEIVFLLQQLQDERKE